jgi:hypothetical protein
MTMGAFFALRAAHAKRDYLGWESGRLALGGLVGLAAFIFLLVPACTTATIAYDRNICQSYADKTNRDVQFTRYNYIEWECLVLTKKGVWVPREQLGDYTGGS